MMTLTNENFRYLMLNEIKILTIPAIHQSWVDPNYAHAFCDSLYILCGNVIECLDFYLNPRSYHIGSIFYTHSEYVHVFYLQHCLKKMFKEAGWDKSDDHYLTSPLWTEVVESAQEAWKVLIENETEEYKTEMEKSVVLALEEIKNRPPIHSTPTNPFQPPSHCGRAGILEFLEKVNF